MTLGRTLTLAAVLGLAATTALAQKSSLVPSADEASRRGDIGRMQAEKARQRFATADADKDGRLSREEVTGITYLNEGFDKFDKSKDGFLSWEEFVGHNRWPREEK